MKIRRIGKIRVGPLVLLCLLVLFYAGFAHAQANWVYTYDGPGPDGDTELAKSVFYGLDGNIYATGFISRAVVNWDFNVTSMTPAGNINWIYQYNVGFMDWAFSIVQGSDYNVYAAGFITDGVTYDEDFFVISLDPSTGDTNWTYRYNGPGNLYDEAWSVVYGLDGNVYAAGYSTSIANQQDFTVISIDPATGNANWIYRYDGTGHSDDGAIHLVYGSDGNVYAAGYTVDISNQQDFTVISIDPATGTAHWIYKYDGTGHSDDAANYVVYGLDGNVYTVGYSTNSGTQQDFTVISLDPSDGSAQWIYQYDGTSHSNDVAWSACYGLDGNVYAAGHSTNSGTQQDFTVVSLDPSTGNADWSYVYPGSQLDRARSIVYGSNGGIYAAGYIYKGTTRDLAIIRLDDSGHELWSYFYDGSKHTTDSAWELVYGSDGNLYAAGVSSNNPTGEDFTVISLPGNSPPTIPVLVTPKNAEFLSDTAVTFVWHASEDPETFADSYIMQYAMDAAFTGPESMVTSDTSCAATLSDTTYYWRVKAEDTEGSQSDWSVVWSFSFDLEAPQTPVLLSPVDDTILTDNSVAFGWSTVRFTKGNFNKVLLKQRGFGDGPPAPVRYVLQVDTAISLPSPIIDDTFDVSTAHYDLAGDLTYYWQVKAFDLGGNEGQYSDAESFIIDLSPPVIDSTTDLDDTPDLGPFTVYTKVTDITLDTVILYYRRAHDPDWFGTEMIIGVSDEWYYGEIPEINWPGGEVNYYIFAEDMVQRQTTDPEDAPASYYSFIGGVAVAEDKTNPPFFSFGLKNNPAKGKAMFSVALPEAALIKLRIYDVSGRLIDELINAQWSAGYYDVPWTSKVSSGVYFYSFESPWQYKAGKLVLVK